MARIAGVDLPREKRVEIGLTYIYGIGRKKAQDIIQATGVNPDTRVRDLSEDDVSKLREYIDHNVQVEGDGIGFVGGGDFLASGGIDLRRRVAAEPLKTIRVNLEGDQTNAVRQNLVLDHRGVVHKRHILDGHAGSIGNHNPAEGVGNRGIDALKIKVTGEIGKVVDIEFNLLLELFNVPRVVDTRVVTGEIC